MFLLEANGGIILVVARHPCEEGEHRIEGGREHGSTDE
jgi:hypothetical protein